MLVEFVIAGDRTCQAIAPEVEAFAKDVEGKVKVVSCDLEKSPGLARQLRIQAVPVFMLFVTIPFARDLVVRNLDLGLFYLIAIPSLVVVGYLMAGFGSGAVVRRVGGEREGVGAILNSPGLGRDRAAVRA